MEDCYDMVLTEADLLKEPTPRLFATMIPSHPGGTVVKSCKSMVLDFLLVRIGIKIEIAIKQANSTPCSVVSRLVRAAPSSKETPESRFVKSGAISLGGRVSQSWHRH